MITSGMPGFEFRYRLNGGPRTVQLFVLEQDQTIARGDIVKLTGSDVGLAVTGDGGLIGAVERVAADRSATTLHVVTDADAVYAVEDRNARTKGSTLDVTGITGAQGVGESVNAEFVVVLDCTVYEDTLVRINDGHHTTPPKSGPHLTGGELNAAVARDVVGLHIEHRGRGPTKARTFYHDDIMVVVLEEVMTPAERSLAAGGRSDVVIAAREAFQDLMRPHLVASIERLTGCKVEAFMSTNHVDPDVAVEVFILDRHVPGQAAEV